MGAVVRPDALPARAACGTTALVGVVSARRQGDRSTKMVDQAAIRDHRTYLFFPFSFAGGHLGRVARQLEESSLEGLEGQPWFPPGAKRTREETTAAEYKARP